MSPSQSELKNQSSVSKNKKWTLAKSFKIKNPVFEVEAGSEELVGGLGVGKGEEVDKGISSSSASAAANDSAGGFVDEGGKIVGKKRSDIGRRRRTLTGMSRRHFGNWHGYMGPMFNGPIELF